MQGDPCAQQHVVAFVEGRVVLLRQHEVPALRPPQRLGVADPAVTVLEVWFERVGHVTGAGLTIAYPNTKLGEPPLLAFRPVAPARLHDDVAELLVAGERSSGEQRRRRVEVGLGERQVVVDRSHCVPQFLTPIPDRVPNRRCHGLDPVRLRVVHQDEVDVTVRGELTAPVPADRDDRELRRPQVVGAGLIGEGRDPVVGRRREPVTVLPPTDRRVVDGGASTLVRLLHRRGGRGAGGSHGSKVIPDSAEPLISAPGEQRHRLPGPPRQPGFVQLRVDVGPRGRAELVLVVSGAHRRSGRRRHATVP